MTQIEKEAFFAQYWGQKYKFPCGSTFEVNERAFPLDDTCYLQLKPLESITDEDAIELFDLIDKYIADGFNSNEGNEEKIITVKSFLFNKKELLTLDLSEIIISFLRSKGYLLPFRQYSTEQLIESGIAKI